MQPTYSTLLSYLSLSEASVLCSAMHIQGPVFALIGAWLICKAQNRDMVEGEIPGSLFWKAMLATALSFVLSNFGPIDDWLVMNWNDHVLPSLGEKAVFTLLFIVYYRNLKLMLFVCDVCRSHFGAAVVGVAYGYLACPTLEMDNASPDSSQKEGITLVKQSADPCKSLIYFSLFILLLCSLLLIIEPPLSSVNIDEF